MRVPFIDLPKQYQSIKKDIDNAIKGAVESGQFIMGDTVKNFEEQMSEYLDSKVVSCASGSDALLISLSTAGVKSGDEVITTPFTFFATAGAIARLGATPVFVDIKSDTYNIDPDLIEKKITERTKAIIPVHIFGLVAEMEKITKIAKKYSLYVIEDACQAIGSKYKDQNAGTFGDFGTFSFFPTKNLGAYGDGGLISVKDEDHYEYLKMFRLHGAKKKYFHDFIGVNSRLDAIQAAILSVKLKYLNEWNEKRRGIAKKYDRALSKIFKTPTVPQDRLHVYHQYPITVDERDDLQNFLKEKDISSSIYYPLPLHLQECFKYLGYHEGDLPISENTSRSILSLPIFPEITDQQIDYVIKTLKEYF